MNCEEKTILNHENDRGVAEVYVDVARLAGKVWQNRGGRMEVPGEFSWIPSAGRSPTVRNVRQDKVESE